MAAGKCAVIQYNINANFYDQPTYNNLKPSPINKLSKASFQKYCAKYNHDFIEITEPKIGYRHPTWERFDLWLDRSWWDKYDQIMYVDTDVIANSHAKNVFAPEIKNEFTLARYTKYRELSPRRHQENNTKTIFRKISPTKIKDTRFQTGFFIVNKLSTQHMLPWIRRYRHFQVDDGQVLNWAVMASRVPIREVSRRYNLKYAGHQKRFKEAYFLHVAGGKKHTHADIIAKKYHNLQGTL